MALKRQLAAVIWAAIIIIAAQLLPSDAQAHAGHDHGPPAAAITSSDHIVDQASSIDAVNYPELTEIAFADKNSGAGSSGTRRCTGTCCGTGATCCGTALLFGVSATLPDPGHARQSVSPAASVPPGTDAEALRKPPKSFA